jgi:two-component system sensor histidine kinase HydH
VKSFGQIATLIVAIAAILGLSAAQLQKERRQLLEELGAGQVAHAQTAAQELGAYLEAMGRDTRILSSLVSRTRQPARVDVDTENRVILSAFEALAAVVPQYRTIALYGADGTTSVTAIDPSEDRKTIANALFDSGRGLAVTVARDGRAQLRGPVRLNGDRFFYLFAAPAGRGEVIVVASDAPLLLHAALPAATKDARYLVFDPQLVVWSGCEQALPCRPATHGELGDILSRALDPQLRWLDAQSASRLGLPASVASLASARAVSTGGIWTLVVINSAARISARESALLRRLIMTVLAAALAVAAVGLFILRQQRNAAALKERLHGAQELATLREKSDAIIENAPIGILGTADDGKVVIANRFMVDRIGSIETGQTWDRAFASAFESGARQLRALLERARADPSGRVEQRGVELLAPGAGHFDVRIVSLRHPADEVRLLALIEDRSELRSLERQLIRAEKILTAGVLSAGLAHEIGTPISVIRGRAEHLLELLAGTPAAEDLAAIVRHSDRISATIGQVLDFSRAQPIHVGAVQPAVALEKARELLDWKLTAKRVSLSVSAPAGVAPLAADPDQLQQVLVNLILNACDACDEGGAIRVDATSAGAGGQVRLDIADDGCGIPVEHLNAIFDPFFTTKKRGEGTGLGLTVAASIVRNHGGTLTVASEPGRGTTLSIVWPAARAEVRA